MPAKYKGTVKAISPQGQGYVPDDNSVLIQSDLFQDQQESQKWLSLAPQVKVNYVKKGECEFDMSEDGFISFLKSTAQPPQQYSKSGFQPGNKYQMDPDRQMDIRAQMLIKAAIQAIKIHNDYMIATEKSKEKLVDAMIKPVNSTILVTARSLNSAVNSLKTELKGGSQANVQDGGGAGYPNNPA